jgi:hypothetical protein
MHIWHPRRGKENERIKISEKIMANFFWIWWHTKLNGPRGEYVPKQKSTQGLSVFLKNRHRRKILKASRKENDTLSKQD